MRRIIYWAKPAVRRTIALGTLLLRPLTVGVRVAVFDAQGRVFLVRHTYLPGWYLPGGGVDPGETTQQAAARELREEGGIHLLEAPRLFGLYLNARLSKRNHVALYVAHAWRQEAQPGIPNREIAEAGFFATSDLPAETTRATRLRLEAIAAGEPDGDVW